MRDLYLKNAQIYIKGHFIKGNVLCQNGKIADIGEAVAQPQAVPCLDCGGLRLAPGFIDAHTHGGMGVDVNAATTAQLAQLTRFFAMHGVTSCLTSVLTDTQEHTLWCIEQIKAAMQERGGTQILGIHLEGPFLAAEFKGAMPESLLQKCSLELYRKYQAAANGAVKYITVSPEVEGVPEFVKEVSDEVVVAIGHSGADYETSMLCIANGARCITHVFNAMKLFHQHFPAIMGAALESDAYCEAICDGRHLHPGTVRMLLKAKGYSRVIAVTDSIMAAGLPDGNYKLGVNDIVVEQGDAKLAENGVRAGSTLTMDLALRKLVEFTQRPVEEVLPLLCENVAAALRIDKTKGKIERGMDADFVLLDARLSVCATIVGGDIVYKNI